MANSIRNWEERKLTKNDLQIQGLLKTIFTTEASFFSQKANLSRGKNFNNRAKILPVGGRYEEFNVTSEQIDSRRLIVDLDSHDVYVSLCHYLPGSFWYAGKVGQLKS